MRILAIETSCDETAVSVIEATGGFTRPHFTVLAHLVSSQVKLHAEWGGVVPSLAKREHSKNLLPLVVEALRTAKVPVASREKTGHQLTLATIEEIREILEREPELLSFFLDTVPALTVPDIDAIAVTQGPGLEPALWVGINCAKALSKSWNAPVIPVNHMEGHIVSVLTSPESKVNFPAIALLISGGHTELVLVRDWHDYKILGQTRDDAVGEAFDKVARILGLPYPGGPEISRLAETEPERERDFRLPRPMMESGDFDFSFSGLKTAVLYLARKKEPLSNIDKVEIATEFQEAVIDVLLRKSVKAIEAYQPKTFIIGGGVIANQRLRQAFKEYLDDEYPKIKLLVPEAALTTDNATMIGLAAYFRALEQKELTTDFSLAAKGNLSLT